MNNPSQVIYHKYRGGGFPETIKNTSPLETDDQEVKDAKRIKKPENNRTR
jgi:hypothetical protein